MPLGPIRHIDTIVEVQCIAFDLDGVCFERPLHIDDCLRIRQDDIVQRICPDGVVRIRVYREVGKCLPHAEGDAVYGNLFSLGKDPALHGIDKCLVWHQRLRLAPDAVVVRKRQDAKARMGVIEILLRGGREHSFPLPQGEGGITVIERVFCRDAALQNCVVPKGKVLRIVCFVELA